MFKRDSRAWFQPRVQPWEARIPNSGRGQATALHPSAQQLPGGEKIAEKKAFQWSVSCEYRPHVEDRGIASSYLQLAEGIFMETTQRTTKYPIWFCFVLFCFFQLLSRVRLFATPWTASLSFTLSRCLLKLMSINSVMPSDHLSLCPPLLFLPSVFPRIRVFPVSWFFI